MSCQGNLNSKAIGVVSCCRIPTIQMGIDDYNFLAVAGDNAHDVMGAQSGSHAGVQIQSHTKLILQACIHSPLREFYQKRAIGTANIETALAAAELLSDLVKSRYLLTFIVGETDPGLRILPTHRVLASQPDAMPQDAWSETLATDFAVGTIGDSDPRETDLLPGAEEMIVIVPGQETIKIKATREACERAELTTVTRRISAAVFDRLVLRPHFGMTADEAASRSLLSYHRLAEDAAREAGRVAGGAAFILPPVSLNDVWAEAQAGRRMPPKTTYFEPKVPSGLLFRPLEE